MLCSYFAVNCALGYYGMSNGSCVPCPVGTYQSNQGNTECIKCPYIRSQTDLGAVLESQCIDICECENYYAFKKIQLKNVAISAL